MILHIKDKDAPIRELTIEQAKFEFRNKVISSSALYWKAGMQEWSRLDQLPDIKEIADQSPKEERLGENWIYRQIDARRNLSEPPRENKSDSPVNKWSWAGFLASAGWILVYIATCTMLISSAITRNEDHNPVVGFLLGLILFRRIYRIQSEKTIIKKQNISLLGYYLHSSAWSFLKWFLWLIPVYVFAVLDAETAANMGENLGKCFGIFLCTIFLGLDVPFWTWRKKSEYATIGYPPKKLAWAIVGAIAIPASIYAGIFLVIPAFQNAIYRAGIASQVVKLKEVSKDLDRLSDREKSLEETSPTSAPTSPESAGSDRVYGKSKAYSLVLPEGWEVTNDIADHDFTASGKGLNFEVIYKPINTMTPMEILDKIKNRLQKNGATDFTDPYSKFINNREWLGITCAVTFQGSKSGSMTCMVHTGENRAFLLMYGSALYSFEKTQPVFDSIIQSFETN